MYSEILERISRLREEFEGLTLEEALQSAREIGAERDELRKKAMHDKRMLIEKDAIERAKNYVMDAEYDPHFFETLDAIRRGVDRDLRKAYISEGLDWTLRVYCAQGEVEGLFMKRLEGKTVSLGRHEKDGVQSDVKWQIIDVSPFDNSAELLSEAICPRAFDKRGYTDMEEDPYDGCGVISCKWEDAEIRRYFNTEFYENAFSDGERAIILDGDDEEDRIRFMRLEEFNQLDESFKKCDTAEYGAYWLSDESKCGWTDTGEMPEICAVNSATGKLAYYPAKTILPSRLCIKVRFDGILPLIG